MKKITLVLAMMGLSTVALAGAPGNNMVAPTGTPVIAPDSTGMWSVGLEALYMESNSNFQYATVTGTDAAGNTTLNNQSVTNNWNWGGEVDVSYMFPGSSRDVSASYTYLNFDNDDSVSSTDNVSGAFTDDHDSAKGNTDQTLNGATLTFGQLLTVGDRVSLHPFAGLQFADIDTDNDARYFDDTAGVATETSNIGVDSDFTGVGPRAGIDAAVHFGGMGNGTFSVVGTFAGALLVGNMDSSVDLNTNLAPTVATDVDNDSYTAIVPELDAKLGLDYMVAFNPNTSMNIQLGYEVVNYFNAEVNDAFDSVVPNTQNSTSDFGYNGPYLRLQLNVA